MEDWASLKELVEQLISKDAKILNAGCGNAGRTFILEFSEDMYSDGYEDIVNIDISSVVIDQMKIRCEKMEKSKKDN